MEESQRVGMERAGRPQVVLLPRDPEVAYLYWEWPGAQANNGASATVSFLADAGDGVFQEIQSFEISDATGGRFLPFHRPGVPHRGELTWADEVHRSEDVIAPRREAGEESAAFVRVMWSDTDGLEVEPTEHEHFTHGRFPAATVAKAGSHSVSKRSE